jgi:hypothetical protein
MANDEDFDPGEDEPLPYPHLDAIDFGQTSAGLRSLAFLGDDMFLGMQAFNIQMVDETVTELEYQVLRELFDTDRTPADAHILNALSQMWVMAVYELLRTWRQRARYLLALADKGNLESELGGLRQDQGYESAGVGARIAVLESAIAAGDIKSLVEGDLARTHIPFRRIEALRMNLAKHENRGQKGSIANMPGYGRINRYCGSLDYELSNGRYVLGTISRRDIADHLRGLADGAEPPAPDDIRAFDLSMQEPRNPP